MPIGVGLASNAALDLAPDQAAALTIVRSMFSLTGGALGVAAIVLVLTYSPDVARRLELVFDGLGDLHPSAPPVPGQVSLLTRTSPSSSPVVG